MYSDLLSIEASILNKTFKTEFNLWGGAGQQVKVGNNDCEPGVIGHKEAFAISTLLFKLKDIITYDYLDKYELFEDLLTNLPDEFVLEEIINRAKRLYWERTENTLYVAYGSNMDRNQMKSRCPQAGFIQVTTIPKYEFIINSRGVASLVENEHASVECVLWEITSACIEALDRYEGVAFNTYRKEFINLGCEFLPNALIYFASNNQRSTNPRSNYLERIFETGKAEGLSPEYLNSILAWKK